MARSAPVERFASLETSPWLPSFGWWPPAAEHALTIVLSTHHATIDPGARYHVVLRGYAGSAEPVWEHEVGVLEHGVERAIPLDDLGLPDPPSPQGGIVEVHAIRLDRPPKRNVGFVGMWIEAVGREGGGYLIPTIPIRGQIKVVKRDDLQVIPGIMSSKEVETELVLLNVVDEPIEIRLVASSASGLVLEADPFTLPPWSVYRTKLSDAMPRLRRLLGQDGGVGSLAVYSSHRVLPYFGFRVGNGPLVSMDHSAPIFA